MAAQMIPNYQFMTSLGSEYLTQPLIEKYEFENVIWPIVLIENNTISGYIYEINQLFKLNHEDDNRPTSISRKPSYLIDYVSKPRRILPNSNDLKPFIAEQFNCSYDFILTSEKFATVDIDYAWKTQQGNWKGLELTTVWMPLNTRLEAERLVKMFTRRPSWRGAAGPHGLRKLINAATDLNIQYYMAVVNSINKVSNNLNTDGNAFWFPLTHANVERILANTPPANSNFGTFKELIEWL